MGATEDKGWEFKAWISRITFSVMYTLLGVQNRYRKYARLHYDRTEKHGNLEDECMLRLRVEDIGKAMECLSDRRKSILEMAGLGFKIEELAQQFDAPTGTIKTNIHRGRIQLKQILAEMEDTREGESASVTE